LEKNLQEEKKKASGENENKMATLLDEAFLFEKKAFWERK